MSVEITRRTALAMAGIAGVAVITACSSKEADGSSASGNVTITVEGPNQWTDSGSSFGQAWDDLIAAFHELEPSITVVTTVLPIASFNETISTQLSAGTAPELVFSQASYKTYMVTALDDYLAKPNPYVDGNEKWIDVFNAEYVGYDAASSLNADGDISTIPFNLLASGVLYNKDVFDEVGVTAPIETFADLLDAAERFRAAGYTPFAMDNGNSGMSWTVNAIGNQLIGRLHDDLDYYDTAGDAGTSSQITTKDWTRAILTGDISTSTEEVAETLRLLKQFFDACATENWSGITNTSGAVVNLKDFSTGKAAMTWGTDYASAALGDVDFGYASMPFPEITAESSDLAPGVKPQSGASTGGTSYMVPSTTTGEKLDATVKFLQFMTSPEHVQDWLNATGAIPALADADVPEQSAGLLDGSWGEPRIIGGMPTGPAGATTVSLYDGYLLGTKDLAAGQASLQELWVKRSEELVESNGWTDEEWAK